MEFVIKPITVIGYHGTSREFAMKLLDEDFQRSEKPWDWLGHGAYFWQDAPVRAYDWATKRNLTEPTVIAARIELTGFIDLLDLEGMETLRGFAYRYKAMTRTQRPTNVRGANRLDCEIFNFSTRILHSLKIPVGGYRAACVEGRKIAKGSPIHDKSHVQVVVLDQRAIKEKWILQTREES